MNFNFNFFAVEVEVDSVLDSVRVSGYLSSLITCRQYTG